MNKISKSLKRFFKMKIGNNKAASNDIGRRDFVRLMGFVSTGLAIGIGNASAISRLSVSIPLSSGFADLSMMDDAVRLALSIPSFSPSLRLAIESDIHSPVAGNVARLVGKNSFSIQEWLEVLARMKGNESNFTDARSEDVHQLAVAVGGIVGKVLANHSPAASLKISAQHDAALVKGISGDREQISSEEIQSLLRGIISRSLTRFHTFIPDDDGIDWTQRISRWRIDMEAYIDEFSKAYSKQSPDSSFYNRKDPFIDASLNSTKGIDTSTLLKKDASCQYGEGLKHGLHVFTVLNQYWKGEETKERVAEVCA